MGTTSITGSAASAPGGMPVSYPSLLERVGHHLFGIRSSHSADQIDDIEECIKDGLRDVYSAHSWSFFEPLATITTTAPYDTGTVTIVDGVVTLATGTFPSWAAVGVLEVDNEYYEVDTRDSTTQVTLEDTSVDVDAGTSYELSRLEYDLPTGFESIENVLTYEPGQSDFYPSVRMRDDDHIRGKQQDDPYTDRPLYFSIRTVEFDPTVGSRRRMSFYPLADAAYVMRARMTLRPVFIDAVNQYPVGGEMLSQIIVEACLAAAERNYDEQESIHTKRFQELLPLSIAADLEASTPTQLGPDAPKSETKDLRSRSVLCGDVTIDGTPM